MAIDFYHRLLVEGPPADVRQLRADLWAEYPRQIGKQRWTEVVPFSFERLYALAPAARRVEPEVPYDPYDVSVWPIRRLSPRRGLLRYRFHTRNLQIDDLVRALSKVRPSLRFMLVSLDDTGVWSILASRGKSRFWSPSERLQARTWARAGREFGLAGEDVYDSAEAQFWVDDQLRDQAMRCWPSFARGVDRGRLRWDNQPVLRDIEMERELAVIELMAARRRRR